MIMDDMILNKIEQYKNKFKRDLIFNFRIMTTFRQNSAHTILLLF